MRKTDNKIIVLNEVESTNNYAKRLIVSDEAEEWTAVMSHFQTKGKGQMGNCWESEPGKNVLLSLILYPGFLLAEKQFLLSKITCLALAEFLKSKVEKVRIKWPNDIYVADGKIAGILVENALKGNSIDSSVVGTGLNLNQMVFNSDAPNPVSLRQLTGNIYDINEAANEILQLMKKWYKKLKAGKEKEIDLAYLSWLYQMEELCWYSHNNKNFKAKIIGVGSFGQLQVQKETGEIKEYMFKEIEFIPPP